MELTLKLVWVCVAIAGILAQIVMLSRAAASLDWRATTRQIVAMGCALVILFFVISMTDDLHDQAILFEEKKPSRVLSEMANPAPSSAAQAVPFVFLLSVSPGSLTVALPAVRKLIDPPQQVLTAALVLREAIDWRAPPLSLA
jgi:choline-glycine betaine transporter